MRSTERIFLYVILVSVVSLLFMSCSGSGDIGPPPPEAVCRSSIDEKCVRCHYKTRICDALGKKSVGDWKKTVRFMVKLGLEMSAEEQNRVIACLHAMPEGSDIVCQ